MAEEDWEEEVSPENSWKKLVDKTFS